ncbi:cupin domain-containing protein [Saccharopolyspora sp. K220]|uniref:cupin domain-containing protein n=1 Tax=Saccharopolyspora soli TaxID=2926618 RepID=UPI001F5AE050|nr:cupin domain-containing protein [Saccharopolyspora soli]MCI2422656.1 cupin domain-containing protein [Saccharopolyspora soli]
MDPKFRPLDHIDVPALARAVTEPWFNQTLCQVNDSLVRLGVVEGEYHWHQHDAEDEFFYVVNGRLIIELDGRDSVELLPGQGVTVPQGLQHRPIAPERTTMLMIEQAGVQPTGD